eukprot:gene12251-15395_t
MVKDISELAGGPANRFISSSTTFSAPKDVLSDFIERIKTLEVKEDNFVSSLGMGGAGWEIVELTWLLQTSLLRLSGWLASPLLSIMRHSISGSPELDVAPWCCSQDCWWAAVVSKYHSRPTLLNLLYEATAETSTFASKSSFCSTVPPYTSHQHIIPA